MFFLKYMLQAKYMSRFCVILFCCIALISAPLMAEESEPLPEDLTTMSIEELMRIKITTLRTSEKLSNSAAAVFVITQEDIQRSSATNIPDLLRMVPGLHVAKIDANKWAVSSRGFNGRFANKLLVLMDGRSLYSPLSSGVLWEAQDTVLEDIERIEIIRGPGATLWGANAVNGVINIITQNTRDTRGVLMSGGVGSEEKAFGTVRYGGAASEENHFRVYAKYFNRDSNADAAGNDAADQWQQWRSGFRFDHGNAEKNQFTLQGDIYQGLAGETVAFPVKQDTPPYFKAVTKDHQSEIFGANLLGRWNRTLSKTSKLVFQAYYDHNVYNPTVLDAIFDISDVDFQHQFQLLSQHSVIWGVGYRFIQDSLKGTYSSSIDPDSKEYDLISAFIQDDITLFPDHWRLTLGTKFENNDFSGTEWQPSARILWTPEDRQSIWAAVSQAIRTPSRGEVSNRSRIVISDDFPIPSDRYLVEALGNPEFESEEVLTYELGYRVQPSSTLSFDIAAFYNHYKNLRNPEIQHPVDNASTPSVVPVVVKNNLDGNSYGVEIATDFRIYDYWRLQLSYNYLAINLKLKTLGSDYFTKYDEGSVPKQQASLRSLMDLNNSWQLDLWARYVDELPSIDINGYFELDVRLNWQIRKDLSLTFAGQNLLDSQHPEYVSEYLETKSTETQRSAYAKMTLKF